MERTNLELDKHFYFYFRVANLELLSQYGVHSWRSHCEVLQQMFELQQKKHADIKYDSMLFLSQMKVFNLQQNIVILL